MNADSMLKHPFFFVVAVILAPSILASAQDTNLKTAACSPEEIAKQAIAMTLVGDATKPNSAKLHQTQTYFPRPCENDRDYETCIDRVSLCEQNILQLIGKQSSCKIARRNEYVYQKLVTSKGYITRRYYPDGRLLIHHVVHPELAYVNIFGAQNQRLLHVTIGPTTISVECNGESLELVRDNTDVRFQRIGDWTKVDEPNRLADFLVAFYLSPPE